MPLFSDRRIVFEDQVRKLAQQLHSLFER